MLFEAGSQESAAMRVSEAHQFKDGNNTTASNPEFGKSLKDMPRYHYTPPHIITALIMCYSMH